VAADLYCSRRDVHRWLPAGEISGPARIAFSALAADDAITLEGHGFETDDELQVRATEGGTLPAPLAEGTTYYAIRLMSARFSLSLTAGGAAINLTTNGTSVVVMREPPFDDVIEFYSRWVDAFMPAHLVPFEAPIHPTVKGIVAELAAKKLMNLDGKSSEIVNQAEIAAKAMLERFASGMPLRPATGVTTAPTNLAVTSRISTRTDPRGWGSGSLP
jgi:hypothetical protein